MDLSFCLIGKNESSRLRRSLSALKKCGQEIVFVDTGSSDDTVAIAHEYTDRIFFFEWINDFSAARNFAMEQASNDMVFFVDCDEYLEDASSCKDVISLMSEYPEAIGQMLRRNLCDDGKGRQTIYEDRVERLFDRRLYKYAGRIHEQPVRRDGSTPSAYHLPMSFFHDGYLGSPSQKKKKGERDLNLLLIDLEENRKNDIADDPYIFYQLGQACSLMSDREKALEYYSFGLTLPLDLSLTYVSMMITNYGNTLSDAGRYDEALALSRYENEIDDYADYFTMLGFSALNTKKYLTSMYYYKKALAAPRYNLVDAADALPHHNLGCIYEAFGNDLEALEHFNAAAQAGHAGSEERALALSATRDKALEQESPLLHGFIFICDQDTDIALLSLSYESLRSQTAGFYHIIATFICRSDMSSTPLYRRITEWEKADPDNILILVTDDQTAGTAVLNTVLQYLQTPMLTFLKPGDQIHCDHVRILRSCANLLHDYSPAIIRYGNTTDKKALFFEPSDEKEMKAWNIPEDELIRIINTFPSDYAFVTDAMLSGGKDSYVLADTGLDLVMKA